MIITLMQLGIAYVLVAINYSSFLNLHKDRSLYRFITQIHGLTQSDINNPFSDLSSITINLQLIYELYYECSCSISIKYI